MASPVKRNTVMEWVRARISDGTLGPGSPVPSGTELSRITGCSEVTCRKALKALRVQGVLIDGMTRKARPRVAGLVPGQASHDAGRALCDELVARRHAAGLRQPDLAELIGHSLTSVGHAETGRLWQSRDWWEAADKALSAGGELIRLHGAYLAAQVMSEPGNPGPRPDVPVLRSRSVPFHPSKENEQLPGSRANEQGIPEEALAGGLLTADEREAVRQAGQLYVLIAGRVVGHGRTRNEDLTEIRAAIHVIQRAVESQATARAYPKEFRLLGEEIPTGGILGVG